MPEASQEDQFYVVCNSEEQYSQWPAGTPVPQGWST